MEQSLTHRSYSGRVTIRKILLERIKQLYGEEIVSNTRRLSELVNILLGEKLLGTPGRMLEELDRVIADPDFYIYLYINKSMLKLMLSSLSTEQLNFIIDDFYGFKGLVEKKKYIPEHQPLEPYRVCLMISRKYGFRKEICSMLVKDPEGTLQKLPSLLEDEGLPPHIRVFIIETLSKITTHSMKLEDQD